MWLALLKLLNKVCAEQHPRMRDQALQLQSRQATPDTPRWAPFSMKNCLNS